MRYLLASLLVLGIGALVLLPQGGNLVGEEGAPRDRDFSLHEDPELAVLQVRYVGGMTARRSTFTLWGDGRLVFVNTDRAGAILHAGELHLSSAEVREVMSLLVDHGLADSSEESIRQEMGDLGRRGSVTDVSTMVVNFSLASYSRDGTEVGPTSKTVSMRGAKAMRAFYPEVEELAGLAELSERLQEYREQIIARTEP